MISLKSRLKSLLKSRLAEPQPLLAPGVYDALSALIAEQTGFELNAALDRAEAYLACGVDALFIEALRTPEQMAIACERFANRIPLLANMVECGLTPIRSAAELGAIGFKIVIFPGGAARAVGHALGGYYASLQAHGSTASWAEQMLDFDGLNRLIGKPELLAAGQRYDPT